ncbi:MAG: ExbD/TolR family protein [Bacteroidia bacterium]
MDIKGRMKPNVEFSTAPIADIVFLLLIYFILTSSFVVTSSLEVELPDGTAASPQNAPNTITVTTDLQYAWNENEITREELPALISETLASAKEITDEKKKNLARMIAWRGDKALPVEELAYSMALIKEGGGVIVILTKK